MFPESDFFRVTLPHLRQGSLAAILLLLFAGAISAQGQESSSIVALNKEASLAAAIPAAEPVPNWTAAFVDPVQGASSADLIARALASNAELQAVRLNVQRARARLTQAGLRPNPSLDFEQQNGVMNSPGERATYLGVSYPLEIGGKRGRRIDLAKAEIEAVEADIADRERRLANAVRATLAEALAAVRELEITAEQDAIDTQAVRVVEVRMNEGDAAPLEANLLRVELERLRSRRALVTGKLQAALLRLQSLTGIPIGQPLKLREMLPAALLYTPPGALDAAIEIALRTRPDLRLARLEEEVAEAGLKLARAEAVPDVTISARYGVTQSSFDTTPIGSLTDRDRIFSVGVSIPLPLFNRKQGATAEAATTITQAKYRREFIEQMVRAEVASSWARNEAVKAALKNFEEGVLQRSADNIRAVRGAYQVGAFRVNELLLEQRRLLDAQREYTEALTERYRALADLQAAIGTPEKQ